MIRFNEVQTELTEELLSGLDKGVIAELEEILDSVLFVYNLTNVNRKKVADTPHDEDGKVIVDLVNPHILEDMDYFRQPAIHFQRHNNYSFLAPNPSPNSDYFKFWKEETRRCREGLSREYDGEWIPGSFYYYLNYSPILKSKAIKGTKAGDRNLGFPDMYDGDYIFYHYVDQARKEGEHAGLLKKRGAGFSYKMGADLGRILKVGYTTKTKERVVAFAIASETEYLMKDGILSKFMSNVAWTDHYTPWPRLKLSESKANMTWKMGYKTKDGQIEGTENEIIGVTTKGDPDKARGKRGPVYWEEWGKFPNLLKSWEVAKQSVQEGDVTFFSMIGGGTGGTVGANFQGAEELFYNCLGYNIRGIPNVFDKNMKGESNCGLFWGAYLNRLRCYDENGNSDVIKALIEILNMRAKIRSNSTDPNTLVQHKAEMPITPQEAIMRREGSIFPVVDLKDHLAQISPSLQKFVSSHYVGHLKYGMNGKAEWDKLQLHPVLRDYPLKRDVLDVYGCLEIYQMPKRRQDGTVQWGRYIAGIDPIDYDISTYSHSMGSIFIFDLLLDRIVAEYTGRPPRASEFYEQALRLLKFYNAEANYENNLKGLFSFFEQKKAMHYLCDTPQILKDMELVKGQLYGNRAHPYSEYIYTPSGKKQWKDVNIGDMIFGDDGRETKVIDIPYDNYTDIYQITLSDSRKVCASKNHQWDIILPCSRKRKTLTTEDLLKKYRRPKFDKKYDRTYNAYEFLIPTSKAIDYKEQCVPIDPYTLGLILGDGTTKNTIGNSIQFTSGLEDVKTYKNICPYEFTKPYDDRHMRIRIPNVGKYIKELNLENSISVNKFIPDIYKYNTKKIRLNILKGLLDSDGSTKEGMPIFYSTSKQLAHDVAFISRSLGYNCKINQQSAGYKKDGIYKKCHDVYTVMIWTTDNLFNLKRKSDKLINKGRKLKARQLGIPIVDIKYSHKEKAKCITVDNNSQCYLINDLVCTHNSKGTNASKMINAWGRKLQADWMISDAYDIDNIDEHDEEGNLIEKVKVLNLQKIRSIAYLKETIAWNPDDNFDRISAMGMLMILREDKLKFERRQLQEDHSQLLKDPWFNRFGGFTAPNKRLRYVKSKFPIKF